MTLTITTLILHLQLTGVQQKSRMERWMTSCSLVNQLHPQGDRDTGNSPVGESIPATSGDIFSSESVPEDGDEEPPEESTLDPEATPFETQGLEERPHSIMAEPVAEALETHEP